MPFSQELESLINRCSIENESNTPDWILAGYILGCLRAWNQAIEERERWYGREPRVGPAGIITSVPQEKPPSQVER